MLNIIDKYTKEELEKIVSESFSYAEVIDKLGYTTKNGRNQDTVKKRLNYYNISTKHFHYLDNRKDFKEENVFIKNSPVSQNTVRRRFKEIHEPIKCDKCGIEAIWDNKPLPLILDHKDGDKHNNELQNLWWLCPNCNQQQWTTGYNGIKKYDEYGNKLFEDYSLALEKIKTSKTNKIKNTTKTCIDCGKKISFNALRCNKCNSILRKQNKIERDDLKNKIRTMSFTEIGREFNVDGNSIKKWCKGFNLPYRKKDIKLYSDEEWELI